MKSKDKKTEKKNVKVKDLDAKKDPKGGPTAVERPVY